MDINSLITPQTSLSPNRLAENALNLKVGQQLNVKVIGAEIQAAKNEITLSLGNKDIAVQSNRSIQLASGQDLKIQVTQVVPVIEFKILDQLQGLKTQVDELRLKLISTARDGGSVATGREPVRPTARDGGSVATGREPARPTDKDGSLNATGRPAVTEKQDNTLPASLLEAKIISIVGNKIQLQIFDASNKPTASINIDRTQLTNAPVDLKAGQNLSLEITKTGTAPEFKIITAAHGIPEAKIAEFTKQFLPRHEASPIFLNQLIKDLPQLMKNQSVPQALKDIAAKIVRNLPPKEQLITSQGLKQAIANSGLFLEAKLPPVMAQAELIKELPQLIKNESVPQSLQRIAAEILRNLTQKGAIFEQPGTSTKLIAKTESASPGLSLTDDADATSPKTGKVGPLVEATDTGGKTALLEVSADDFKANLLKFIHALKQELNHQGDQSLNKVDLDLLKNLQTKTENTVAKLVLDQLMSLPKDDNPKQQWIIDIPFIDRQQAESVKIEIQRDKEKNKQQPGSNDWSVNITITPPELGTIHCLVSYRNEVINTFFKSPSTQTTELIKHNLDYLKNQLEESGLKTGHMDAHDGAQKTQPTHPHQLAGKKLFDDKA